MLTSRKIRSLRSLGATYFIDHTKEDYTRSGKQYDYILDVTAQRLPDYKRALKPGGIFSMIGGSMGGLLLSMIFIAPLISRFSNKKMGLMGYKVNREGLDELMQLVEENKLSPIIDKTYPLAEVPAAFKYYGEGNFKGKIIIMI